MSAWVLQPKPKQSSLVDIMTEQLITQLNDSSPPSSSPPSTSSFDLPMIIPDEFQVQESNEIDSDLALALALQEMEDFEVSLNQQQQLSIQGINEEFSKINIITSLNELGTSYAPRKGANILDEEDLDSYASLTDHRVINGLRSFEQKRHQKGISSSGRISNKDIKVTFEGVLDPTTRMILYKLIQNNYIDKIYGIIKTGKEANVYHAYHQDISGSNNPSNNTNNNSNRNNLNNNNQQNSKFRWNKSFTNYAIKIFKTTLNEFSNRQDYFHGDHRYNKQKFSKGGIKESIAKVFSLLLTNSN